jgi:peptidoglycan L-alanyl-D-glutamate endopeptidase CwlK
MSSRDINDLHPEVAALCHQFVAKCKAQGITILVTSTYRSIQEQDALYAQGRTKPGAIVTNARGGYSFHSYGVAFDIVPIVNGKAQWNSIALFRRCGEIGKSVGLEWAGDWKSMREYCHFQRTQGMTLADFRAGKHVA